jgi:mannose-1-phosphate guanylyltransferase/phosphomannomutase
MKAFILAAGLGTRLRPLTFKKPKPLIECGARPVIDYVLRWLVEQGIEEVIINLHYLPDMIKKHLGRGGDFGVKITYSYEKNILGTAGALKKMEKLFKETFLVACCDAITNIDIHKALGFHRKKGALATMVVKRTKSSQEYGIIGLDSQDRVCQFLNRHRSAEPRVKANHTGIAILEPAVLEYIPPAKFYCLEEVYLKMLKARDPLFGYLTEELWYEIGSLKSLEKASKMASEGLLGVK